VSGWLRRLFARPTVPDEPTGPAWWEEVRCGCDGAPAEHVLRLIGADGNQLGASRTVPADLGHQVSERIRDRQFGWTMRSEFVITPMMALDLGRGEHVAVDVRRVAVVELGAIYGVTG